MNNIALLTDFGLEDYYVGVMKGVMSSINPDLKFIDINHNIPPGDIHKAAYQLYASYRYFPEKTIFLIVVDPGVGTNRKSILVKTDKYFFICPDNGILTYILRENKAAILAVEINNIRFSLKQKSNTFHGRDLFSPAAAYFSLDPEISRFGILLPAKDLITLKTGEVNITDDYIEGSVIDIDRFGNIITNITAELFKNKNRSSVKIGSHLIPVVKTYADVNPGQPLALIGSSGLLEISVNRGSARELLQLSEPNNGINLHLLN